MKRPWREKVLDTFRSQPPLRLDIARPRVKRPRRSVVVGSIHPAPPRRCYSCGHEVMGEGPMHADRCGVCWLAGGNAPLPPCERPETPDEPPQHAA